MTGYKSNPYQTIAILKKSLKKTKEELKQSELKIKEIKKELDWEKSRSQKLIENNLPYLLEELKKEMKK